MGPGRRVAGRCDLCAPDSVMLSERRPQQYQLRRPLGHVSEGE
jgi:hypothetical protein